MNEEHFKEIEKALLYVSEARERTAKAQKQLAKAGAEPHLVSALAAAENELQQTHRRLMQGTYWAIPEAQRLAV